MIDVVIRTFITILIMELGSASNLTIAAMSSNSSKPIIVCLSGIMAIIVASFLAMKLSSYLKLLPVSINLVSGIILISTGVFFIWKSA